MLKAEVNKGKVSLKCCGEIAEIAADIAMIVNGIYSQIQGEEEKEAFKAGIQFILASDPTVWNETRKGTGVYMVLPKFRGEESK